MMIFVASANATTYTCDTGDTKNCVISGSDMSFTNNIERDSIINAGTNTTINNNTTKILSNTATIKELKNTSTITTINNFGTIDSLHNNGTISTLNNTGTTKTGTKKTSDNKYVHIYNKKGNVNI